MGTLDALLHDLTEVAGMLERDESVDGELLEELSRRTRELAPDVPRKRQQELVQAFNTLVDHTHAHRERIDAALRRLGHGHRALRTYGHLRGHHRGQRLNRNV